MRASLSAALLSLAALCGPALAETYVEPIDPALYVVRDADSTLYLYGTVHVRPRDADWASGAVREALGAAQEIWTEIEISPAADARAQTLALELGLAPQGQGLSTLLDADENARLAALTQRLGMPANALEAFEPWMAALTLTIVPIMQAGYDPASGVDRAVDAYGDANGRTMRALETAEFQLSVMSGMPPEVQRQMLREAIAEAEKGPLMLAEMTQAWEQGDMDRLTQLVVEDTRRQHPELHEALFARRNAAWADILGAELEGAGVDFVAVGAGHLGGADGLVELLRARGYEVARAGD